MRKKQAKSQSNVSCQTKRNKSRTCRGFKLSCLAVASVAALSCRGLCGLSYPIEKKIEKTKTKVAIVRVFWLAEVRVWASRL